MDGKMQEVARRCLHGAETDAMTFPQIVGALIDAGFEGYAVDFRGAAVTYYGSGADSFVLATLASSPIAAAFDGPGVQSAIREAQSLAPGYTYAGFCAKVAAAGCAGYLVSFPGRRALYYGRDAQTHIERFPE